MIPAAGRRRRGWRFPMIFASEWWRRSFWAAVAQCARQAFRCEHRKRGALGDALQDHGADFAFRGRSPVRPYRGARDRRTPDITLLEIQERLIQNGGERFSVSVLWRFFDRHGVTFKKDRARRGAAAPGRFGAAPGLVRLPTRS